MKTAYTKSLKFGAMLLGLAVMPMQVVASDNGKKSADPFQYPMEGIYRSNPLFVDFPSPMFETDSIGTMYTADASAHVWSDGRLYLYASHDIEPSWGCDRMDRYHVFSTDDMVHWTDHGEILNSDDVKRELGWGIPGWMWAPDCAYNPADSTYYFYFPHPAQAYPWGGHEWRVGVATSKSPVGGFKPIGYVEGTPSLIDPAVFVDDDGQPYIYIGGGGGGGCQAAKLCKDDWTRLDGEMKRMEGLVDFHEAAWVHKYNGRYYLTHSDNHGSDGNQMRYAMSDSPLGPWKDMGVYIYATGCGTIHGSIVQYKNKWYAVYHSALRSDRDELRSVCIDELKYNPDGTIQVVQNWGKAFKKPVKVNRNTNAEILAERFNRGGEGRAYHKLYGAQPMKKGPRKGELVVVEKDATGTHVAEMTAREWLRYSVDVEESVRCQVNLYVRPQTDSIACHLSADGTAITMKLGARGDVGQWKVFTVSGVDIPKGTNYLDFRVDHGTLDFDAITIQPLK